MQSLLKLFVVFALVVIPGGVLALDIKPVFSNNYVPVVMASDNNYALYLGVALSSIKKNNFSDKSYDILILDGGISSQYKDAISSLSDEKFSIRFFDVKTYFSEAMLRNLGKNIYSYFSSAIYYRLFIPEVFKNYDRVIYLDADIVVNDDLNKLYLTNLNNKALAGAIDLLVINKDNYLTEKLEMNNPDSYFNSGVLIFDVQKFRQNKYVNEILLQLDSSKKFLYPDQDILNIVFDGDIVLLDNGWNSELTRAQYIKNNTGKYPQVIHWLGGEKPWNSPYANVSEIWWEYAKDTPFYSVLQNKICKIYNDKLNVRLLNTESSVIYIKKNVSYLKRLKFINGLKMLFFWNLREFYRANYQYYDKLINLSKLPTDKAIKQINTEMFEFYNQQCVAE